MRQPIGWILACIFVIGSPYVAGTGHGSRHGPTSTAITPGTARRLLDEGNARFRSGSISNARRDQDRRCETFTGGQHPYAIVLSCADSRAPVEYLFDAGLGDLFVVRVAGNVANTDEIGSIEYAVEHLGTPLIVVLGHTKCGAVTAVVEHAHVSESIAKLVAPIVPAAKRAQQEHPTLAGSALVDAAIRENVRQSIHELRSNSSIVREAVAAKKVEVIGGVYDLHTGSIEWLDVRPIEAAADAPATAEPAAPHHETASTSVETHEITLPEQHAEPHKPHEDGSQDAHPDAAQPSSDAKKQPRENFAALGGLLGGAAVVSTLAIRFMSNRRA